MNVHFLLLSLILSVSTFTNAAEPTVLAFKFSGDVSVSEVGLVIVTPKKKTWSNGLKRSYLKLSCKEKNSGDMQKLYSTVDHFSGLSITHQLVGDSVELTAVRNKITSRLSEIRALNKSECKNISPVVSTTKKTYRIPVNEKVSKPLQFDQNSSFQFTFQSQGKPFK